MRAHLPEKTGFFPKDRSRIQSVKVRTENGHQPNFRLSFISSATRIWSHGASQHPTWGEKKRMEKATRKRDSAKPTGELLAGQQDALRQLVQRRRGVTEAEMEEAMAAEKAREDGVIRSEAGVMAIGADREARRKLLAGELFGANSRAVGRIFELPSLPSVTAAVFIAVRASRATAPHLACIHDYQTNFETRTER